MYILYTSTIKRLKLHNFDFQYQYHYQSWIYIAHKRKASNATLRR